MGSIRVARVDRGDDRQPGPQGNRLQNLLGEGDAHRDPLNDLGEIAGRVVGRQQRELRARGRRDRRDDALDRLAVERVDGDVGLLSRLDPAELGLLVIGVDIGRRERHQRHQARSRRHQVSDLGRLVADHAVERRHDPGEAEVALGFGERGHQFVALAGGLVALRLEDIEIGLRALERGDRRSGVRLGGGQRGDRAIAIGGGLLEPLLGAEIGLGELVRPVVFQGGALNFGLAGALLRLRGVHLGPGLGDDRGLSLDLPAEPGDRRVLRADLGLRVVDRDPVVAVVDQGDEVALAHGLIVDDRHLHEMPGGLGRDDGGVGADIGVVGADEKPPLDVVVVGELAGVADGGQHDDRENEAAQAAGPLRRGHLGGRPSGGPRPARNAGARRRRREARRRRRRDGARLGGGRGHCDGFLVRYGGTVGHKSIPLKRRQTERFGHFLLT